MAQGNGHIPEMEYTKFTIAGKEYNVPPLNLYVLDVCNAELNARIEPEDPVATYAKNVMKIVSVLLDDPALMTEEVWRHTSYNEMKDFPLTMRALLQASGFEMGEAEAVVEQPGTGTLNPSPPNSQQTESSRETLTQ